jgi:hypothetical protein
MGDDATVGFHLRRHLIGLVAGGVVSWPLSVYAQTLAAPKGSGVPGPDQDRALRSPGNTVLALPADSLPQLQKKVNGATDGSTVLFMAGNYDLNGSLRGKANVTFAADGVCSLNGGMFDFSGLGGWTVRGKAPGQGFEFSASASINADNASGLSAKRWAIGNCRFLDRDTAGMTGSAVRMNNVKYGLLINNDFTNCSGNVLGCYNWDNIVLDGNRFVGCWQPVSCHLPHNNDHRWGNNLVFQRNVFLKSKRCELELGPGGTQYFNGAVFDGNFFDDHENANDPVGTVEPQGTLLPISLVGMAAQNSRVQNNFIRRGDFNRGLVCIAIEIAGSGDISNNILWNFPYAVLMYNSGWNIHDNKYYCDGTSPRLGYVQNNPGSGTVANNRDLTSPPQVPAQPARMEW